MKRYGGTVLTIVQPSSRSRSRLRQEGESLKTALFPGSFDPFHNGHLEIVEIASKLFDHVVVAPMRNTQKGQPLFTLEERTQMIADSVAHLPNVSADVVVGAHRRPGPARSAPT